MNPNNDFLRYTSLLSIREFNQRVRRFRQLNLRGFTHEQIRQAIHDVLMVNGPNGPFFLLPTSFVPIPVGHRLYRIRWLDKDSYTIPHRDMLNPSQAWEPPPDKVIKPGRLHNVGESLLYTADSPGTAYSEVRMKDGVPFCLCVYEVKEAFNAADIGCNHMDFGCYVGDVRDKMELIMDFLRNEFSRDVAEGLEFLYKASCFIAKEYYDLPPSQQQAWFYPSVIARPAYNICFKPNNARKKLHLVGVVSAVGSRIEDNIHLRANAVAVSAGGNAPFVYHPPGNPGIRQLFHELLSTPGAR